ncbi:universal stress protein [Salinispirillum marinum]|uniref:Universal stress protein n=2 Tax=Saccharospirillaceae TaxID=255527 RepID=A0ABV8B9F0_9GAMM
MNPILVYFDPAEDNVSAFKKAAYLARTLNTSLFLFTTGYNSSLANNHPVDAESGIRSRDAFIGRLEQSLTEEANLIRELGVDVSVKAVWDKSPWHAIATLLETEWFEFIIKGTHHQNVMQRTFFSSTDWDLIRCSPLPVLLVKSEPWPAEHLHLTACVDPIEHDDQPKILDKAIVMQGKAWQDQLKSTLDVLNVYDPTPFMVYMDPPIPDTTPITEALAAQHQEALNALLNECGLPPEQGRLEAGTPTATIPDVLYEGNTHIVIMGAQTREGLGRWLIGHTAEKVLDRITCDILVIKTG